MGKYFDCQITTKKHRSEALKRTEISEDTWYTISVDFEAPYPNGYYNLVLVNKRSRHLVVEEVT